MLPAFRRRGIASALLAAARDVAALDVNAAAPNAEARAFYEPTASAWTS